jgi:ATP-dependent RNA helicase DHX29
LDSRKGPKSKGGTPTRTPSATPKRPAVTFDEDIEPDELLPQYLETKAKLFAIQRPRQDAAKRKGAKDNEQTLSDEEALLLAKLDRIEKDVLFDKFVAEGQWRTKRIALEKEYAAARAAEKKAEAAEKKDEPERPAPTESDDVAAEAERMAAELLAEADDDDDALAGLFASLPVSEVDPVTGKSNTVMNGADGSKITIRDFGQLTSGVSPMQILKEACRARLALQPPQAWDVFMLTILGTHRRPKFLTINCLMSLTPTATQSQLSGRRHKRSPQNLTFPRSRCSPRRIISFTR